MDMESQKILFALSTPMEIRNECCLPSHSSPKMYLGTCFFDLSSSWGIDDRDDLLRTIHRMIENGHAARLAGFYHRWFRYSPCEWRNYLAEQMSKVRLMRNLSPAPPNAVVREELKPGIMSGWVF